RERDLPPVDVQPQKSACGRAVELQPGRDKGWLGNQQVDVKAQVRNGGVIVLKHLAVAGQAKPIAVMTDFVMHETAKVRPVPGIQTGDVVSVDAGQFCWSHRQSSAGCFALSVCNTLVQLRRMR